MMGAYGFAHQVVIDYIDWILGRRGAFTPPRHILNAARVAGRFNDIDKVAHEIFRCVIELGELKSSETVLEVGCGIGRNAASLTTYLNQGGTYEGFDIVPLSIGWCQQKISREYPNFRFRLGDIYNKAYNPKAKLKPSEYKFPYKDEFFDFVFLTSVFTHMMPEDVKHYLSEIVRVLKTGGRCMITFFLLNQESLMLLNSGLSFYDLRHETGPCRFMDQEIPEAAIAYQEEYIRAIYRKKGLAITEPINYGWWCRREKGTFSSGQDIIMARKIGQ